jgi:hypothetical protein
LKNIRTVSKDVGLCKITLGKFNGKESEKNLRENLKMNVGEISLEDVNSSLWGSVADFLWVANYEP